MTSIPQSLTDSLRYAQANLEAEEDAYEERWDGILAQQELEDFEQADEWYGGYDDGGGWDW